MQVLNLFEKLTVQWLFPVRYPPFLDLTKTVRCFVENAERKIEFRRVYAFGVRANHTLVIPSSRAQTTIRPKIAGILMSSMEANPTCSFLQWSQQGLEGDPLRVRPGGPQELQGDQAAQVPGDHRPPDRPKELRSPEGQAFLRHRQVRSHTLTFAFSLEATFPLPRGVGHD